MDIRHMKLAHLHQSGSQYPLIIRIESLNSAVASYGNYDIRALPTGGALPHGVNAHTIMAKFKFGDGFWEVIILHQKLWVNGTGYDMPSIAPAPKALAKPQAIVLNNVPAAARAPERAALPAGPPVGMVPGYAPPPLKPAAQQYPAISYGGAATAPARCMICHTQPVALKALPCNHASMCYGCAVRQQKALNNYCPQCYKAIQGLQPIAQHSSPRGKAGAAA